MKFTCAREDCDKDQVPPDIFCSERCAILSEIEDKIQLLNSELSDLKVAKDKLTTGEWTEEKADEWQKKVKV